MGGVPRKELAMRCWGGGALAAGGFSCWKQKRWLQVGEAKCSGTQEVPMPSCKLPANATHSPLPEVYRWVRGGGEVSSLRPTASPRATIPSLTGRGSGFPRHRRRRLFPTSWGCSFKISIGIGSEGVCGLVFTLPHHHCTPSKGAMHRCHLASGAACHTIATSGEPCTATPAWHTRWEPSAQPGTGQPATARVPASVLFPSTAFPSLLSHRAACLAYSATLGAGFKHGHGSSGWTALGSECLAHTKRLA